jgi:hypothetical protein
LLSAQAAVAAAQGDESVRDQRAGSPLRAPLARATDPPASWRAWIEDVEAPAGLPDTLPDTGDQIRLAPCRPSNTPPDGPEHRPYRTAPLATLLELIAANQAPAEVSPRPAPFRCRRARLQPRRQRAASWSRPRSAWQGGAGEVTRGSSTRPASGSPEADHLHHAECVPSPIAEDVEDDPDFRRR